MVLLQYYLTFTIYIYIYCYHCNCFSKIIEILHLTMKECNLRINCSIEILGFFCKINVFLLLLLNTNLLYSSNLFWLCILFSSNIKSNNNNNSHINI